MAKFVLPWSLGFTARHLSPRAPSTEKLNLNTPGKIRGRASLGGRRDELQSGQDKVSYIKQTAHVRENI